MIPGGNIKEEDVSVDSKSADYQHHEHEERTTQFHKFGADFRPFVSNEKSNEYWDDKGNERDEELKVRQLYGFVCIKNVFAKQPHPESCQSKACYCAAEGHCYTEIKISSPYG